MIRKERGKLLNLDHILDMYRENKILKEDVKVFFQATINRAIKEHDKENNKCHFFKETEKMPVEN